MLSNTKNQPKSIVELGYMCPRENHENVVN